jgi:hypothetical protein
MAPAGVFPSPQAIGVTTSQQAAFLMAPIDRIGPAARAGVQTKRDVDSMFDRGYLLYWDGHYSEALAWLRGATAQPEADARAWYYRGLAELNLGDQASASASFDRAARLQAAGMPSSREVSLALVRLQGPLRQQLNQVMARAGEPRTMVARRP